MRKLFGSGSGRRFEAEWLVVGLGNLAVGVLVSALLWMFVHWGVALAGAVVAWRFLPARAAEPDRDEEPDRVAEPDVDEVDLRVA